MFHAVFQETKVNQKQKVENTARRRYLRETKEKEGFQLWNKIIENLGKKKDNQYKQEKYWKSLHVIEKRVTKYQNKE